MADNRAQTIITRVGKMVLLLNLGFFLIGLCIGAAGLLATTAMTGAITLLMMAGLRHLLRDEAPLGTGNE